MADLSIQRVQKKNLKIISGFNYINKECVTFSRHGQISSSENVFHGSKFDLRVPVSNIGSCNSSGTNKYFYKSVKDQKIPHSSLLHIFSPRAVRTASIRFHTMFKTK